MVEEWRLRNDAFREQLLHARCPPPGQGSTSSSRIERDVHWTHLARMAQPGAHYRWHAKRDDGVSEGFQWSHGHQHCWTAATETTTAVTGTSFLASVL